MKRYIFTSIFTLLLSTISVSQEWTSVDTDNIENTNSGDVKLSSSSRLLFEGATTGPGILYRSVENSSFVARYALMFDYTNNASYPFLTNRTPGGKVVIKTGTASGGGENTHFTIEGGDGTVDAYFENANLGIGTTSPGYLLDIQGTNSNQDLLRLSHPTSPTAAGLIIGFGKNKDQTDNGAIDFKVEYSNTDYSIIGINRVNRDFYYNGAGNVGIGTDAPSSNLHITSGTSGSAVVLIEADTDNDNESDHAQLQLSQDGGAVIGTVGYKTVGSDNNQLVIENGWNNAAADILFQRSGITNMIIEGDGNVGVGTSSPDKSLVINTDTNTDGIRINGSAANAGLIIQNSGSGGNEWSFSSTGSSHGSGEGKLILYNSDDFLTASQIAVFDPSGKMGIGTDSPDQLLTVAGTINSQEVIVEEDAGADFVFESDYTLPTLEEVETFIQANKHLEGIPSAEEMIEEGVKVGELQMALLQKIEELTLYTISQEQEIQNQASEINELKELVDILISQIETLQNEN